MRVLIVSFLPKDNGKCKTILSNLEKAAVAKGHQVDVKNGETDRDKIHTTLYEYIAVVVQASPLFGAKVPEALPLLLRECGTVSGKKSCALVVKRGLSSGKMCSVVMHAMEKEGMFLDYFEVVLNANHAAVVGKKIG